jgi:hypothetical protein
LISFKCFLEINSDLGGHFSEFVSWQTRITSLSEEKILRLCKAKVAIHLERLFCKIQGRLASWDLGHEAHQLVENPGSLLEVKACLFDTVTSQVHVAAHTSEANGIVVHR